MTVLQIRKNKKYHKPHEMTLKIAFKKFTPSGDKPNARQTNFTMAIIYYFSYWKKKMKPRLNLAEYLQSYLGIILRNVSL